RSGRSSVIVMRVSCSRGSHALAASSTPRGGYRPGVGAGVEPALNLLGVGAELGGDLVDPPALPPQHQRTVGAPRVVERFFRCGASHTQLAAQPATFVFAGAAPHAVLLVQDPPLAALQQHRTLRADRD